MIYETIIELPIGDTYEGQTARMVEKVREVAYPRMHVRIEAADRRELDRIVSELNVELSAMACRELVTNDFGRGRHEEHLVP